LLLLLQSQGSTTATTINLIDRRSRSQSRRKEEGKGERGEGRGDGVLGNFFFISVPRSLGADWLGVPGADGVASRVSDSIRHATTDHEDEGEERQQDSQQPVC